ncbi:MAG: type II toxin-antitoxin system VapC family toxin [Candidatus Bathyarchaeia archaeon]
MGEKEVRADAVIDVGILAVGLSRNPATDYCLEVIEDAVRGRIRALIPYTVVFGAHYILTRFYGVEPKEANNLLRNLLLSQRIIWYGHIDRSDIEKSFENTEKYDLDAGDGHILHLMEVNEIRIIYTLDVEHFGKINWLKTINPIPDVKMKELRDFLQRKG